MAAQEPRIRLGYPLDPKILEQTEAYDVFLQAPANFDPNSDWTQSYAIWGFHGYRVHPNSNNRIVGFLNIRRRQFSDSISLKIDQHSMGDHGYVHRFNCLLQCSYDHLTTPVKWEIKNTFEDYNGKSDQRLSYSEKGHLQNKTVVLKRGDKTKQFPVSSQLTSDWSLFEAVQRMKMQASLSKSFDVLFGLDTIRPDHHLTYRGIYKYEKNGNVHDLHLLHEIGCGALPYEYYLNRENRLMAVFTSNVAYLFNPNAKEHFQDKLSSTQKETQKRYRV